MLHLLPNEYRDKIRKIYLYRFGVLSVWLIFCLGIVGVVSLIPAYLLVHFEKQDISSRLGSVGGDMASSTEESKLKSLERKIDTNLSYISDSKQAVEKIEKVLALKNSGVGITAISVDKDIFTIGGISATRSDLFDFEKKLKSQEWISNVDLPVKVFAQDKDISFNAVLTIPTNENK